MPSHIVLVPGREFVSDLRYAFKIEGERGGITRGRDNSTMDSDASTEVTIDET